VFKVAQHSNSEECTVFFADRTDKVPTGLDTAQPTVTTELISLHSKVQLESTKVIRAKYVISAVPLYINGRYIEFTPALPPTLHRMYSRCYAGTYWKAYAFFDDCFWQRYGFSGEITTDGENGPILWAVQEDTTHLNNDQTLLDRHWKGRKVYCLVALSGSSTAFGEWNGRTPKQREEAFVAQLSMYFNALIPNDRDLVRRHLVDFFDVLWRDCAPFDILPPGTGLHAVHNERQSDFVAGNVHFASTNFGPAASGYMEGAVSSGYAQAQLVFDKMCAQSSVAAVERVRDCAEECTPRDPGYVSTKRKVVWAVAAAAVVIAGILVKAAQ
jgi:monoamine oxidase